MKKPFLISIFLILAVMATAISPVFAAHPSHGHQHHDGHRDERSHHRTYRGHHRRNHHHRDIMFEGFFFMVMNEFQERNEAHSIMKRTVGVLKDAQTVGKENNFYLGLGKAIAHQTYAQAMFERCRYKEAIYHTLWARAIALHFMEAPSPTESAEDDWQLCDFRDCDLVYSQLTDVEADYMETAPSPIEMREEINDLEVTDESAACYELK